MECVGPTACAHPAGRDVMETVWIATEARRVGYIFLSFDFLCFMVNLPFN